MKQLKQLYRYAEKRNIEVSSFSLPETASMSLRSPDGACYIAIDPRLPSESAERVHLSHELGHCLTGSFYNRYAPQDLRQKHENRADKWAIRKLIPAAELDDAVAAGHTQLWDLADYFGVTEAFMRKAVSLYTHGNLASELYF